MLMDDEDMVSLVRKHLVNSKQFGKVHYVSFEERSDCHYHFEVMITGKDMQDRLGLAMLSGLTITAVPIWYNYHMDFSMSYLVRKQEVFSVASPEEVTDFIWLPMVVASPFMNHGTITPYVESKAMDYFVSEIKNNNLNAIR